MYTSKITFIVVKRANDTYDANLNTREIAHFHKYTKIYTCKNIHVHSNNVQKANSPCENMYVQFPFSITSTYINIFYCQYPPPSSHTLTDSDQTALLILQCFNQNVYMMQHLA